MTLAISACARTFVHGPLCIIEVDIQYCKFVYQFQDVSIHILDLALNIYGMYWCIVTTHLATQAPNNSGMP